MSECKPVTVNFFEMYELAKKFNSKQSMVAFYLMNECDKNSGLYLGTYKKIAKETGVSEPTVAKIVKSLTESQMLTKIQNGAWKVNIRFIPAET